jgi:hypothetical protein
VPVGTAGAAPDAAPPEPVAPGALRALQDRLVQEQIRRANAERAARDAELAAEAAAAQRAQTLEMEIRRLRERLEDPPTPAGATAPSDADVGAIRLELESVRRELEGVRAEVDATRIEREAARAEADLVKEKLARTAAQEGPAEPPDPGA